MQTLRPESGLRTAANWPKIRNMTSQFFWMTSSLDLFDVVLFLLSSLVTGLSFMSISSLVLELWQFSFIRDWPEIRKSEIPPSEVCPISGDWVGQVMDTKFGTNVSNRMLLNAAKLQGYSFFRFWVIKGKPTWGVKLPPPPSPPPTTQIRVNVCQLFHFDLIKFDWFVTELFD